MRTKLGAPKAIAATAHKLARTIYHLLTPGNPMTEVSSQSNNGATDTAETRLKVQARSFGFALVPLPD